MPVRHSERSLGPLISTRIAMPSIENRRVGDGRGFLQADIQAVGDTYTRKALISPTKETVGKGGILRDETHNFQTLKDAPTEGYLIDSEGIVK